MAQSVYKPFLMTNCLLFFFIFKGFMLQTKGAFYRLKGKKKLINKSHFGLSFVVVSKTYFSGKEVGKCYKKKNN